VEYSLKDGENLSTEKQMDTLRLEMADVLYEFDAYREDLPYPTMSEGAGPVYDAEKALDVIRRLEPLLKSGNIECLKLVDELQMVPGSGEVIQHMKDFYFRAAVKLLAELKKDFETDKQESFLLAL